MVVPIIMPAFEPDDRMIYILDDLKKEKIEPIIVINDGSNSSYNKYYEYAKKIGAIVLQHEQNCGKGRALKTAFDYCLNNYKDMNGCITIDSDGQHSVKSIKEVKNAIKKDTKLILGVRDFTKEDIPTKSKYGNNITKGVFKYIYKTKISDTQTGLRYISKEFMKELLDVKGERFEFETRMLIKAIDNKYDIAEVQIDTIYDSKENHQTHFRPVKDSIRIYSIFFEQITKFTLSSLSSSVIDLTLFQILCIIFKNNFLFIRMNYIILATILARIISAIYNYTINYYIVFNSKEKHIKSASKYLMLAIIQMLLSACFTTFFVSILLVKTEVFVKIPVDLILFLISYNIQKKMFNTKRK